ncbi:DUF177 domain-containing protein [candidate division KSB1 bacterium]|nr:DUF177 domain-containing protein [candidate division KSB1 bacterium]
MKIYINRLEEGLNELTHDYEAESLDLISLVDREVRFNDPVHVQVNINKVHSQYFFQIFVETSAIFVCDRCLEDFEMSIRDNFRVVYSTEKSYLDEQNDDLGIRYLHSESDVVDLSEDVRESVLLAIPMKVLCSGDCKGICPECGANLNKGSCIHQQQRMDPKWEALKGLSDKHKKNN